MNEKNDYGLPMEKYLKFLFVLFFVNAEKEEYQ